MKKRQQISNATIFGLVIVHLAIALPLAFSLNIWADEASTLHTTQQGLIHAIARAAADEKQAPLYFWILSLWRLISDSIFFARFFSIICSVAAIFGFARLAARLFGPRTALLATAFFALHPFLIWASLEIRVYSLVILLSVVLLFLFFEGFVDKTKDSPLSSKIAFVGVAVVALYSNYYLGFLAVGFFLALLITKRWRDTRNFSVSMLIVAIILLPLASSVKSQFLANTAGYRDDASVFDTVQFVWHHGVTFLLPGRFLTSDDGTLFEGFQVWLARVGVVAMAVLAIKYRQKLSPTTRVLGAITFAIIACFVAASLVLGPTYAALRHASPIFVPLILLVASLCSDILSQLTERAARVTAFVLGLAVLTSFSYSLTTLYPNTTKRGDWARVGTFIEQNESPGQPIVVFTTFDALALPYHYRGVNKILPDEGFFDFDQEAAFGTADSLKRQTEFVISEIPSDAEWLWLAVNEKCLATEACVPLGNFIEANYTIEKEQQFYLEKLVLLRKKRQ